MSRYKKRLKKIILQKTLKIVILRYRRLAEQYKELQKEYVQKCKILPIFFLLFFSSFAFSTFSQRKIEIYDIQKDAAKISLQESKKFRKNLLISSAFSAAGGASHGFNQTISHHYGRFERYFPNANERFWNPNVSHTNPTMFGYKPDAYHLSNSFTQISMFAAGGFAFSELRKSPKSIPLFLIVNFVSYSAANWIVYDVVFYK